LIAIPLAVSFSLLTTAVLILQQLQWKMYPSLVVQVLATREVIKQGGYQPMINDNLIIVVGQIKSRLHIIKLIIEHIKSSTCKIVMLE